MWLVVQAVSETDDTVIGAAILQHTAKDWDTLGGMVV